MPTMLENTPQINDQSMNMDIVIEPQDKRWVVIVRYLHGSDVVRAQTHSFENQAQAVLYQLRLQRELN